MNVSPGAVNSAYPNAGDKLFLKTYLASHKVAAVVCTALRFAETGVRGVVTGLSLGFMTPHRIRLIDNWYYTNGFPMYLDTEYNKSGLFDWEKAAVDTYFPKNSSILLAAGAGGGREMLALYRMGMRVDGFEYNPALTDLGNKLLAEEGFPPTITTGPPDQLLPNSKKYDAAIVGWGTYTLIESSTARIELLKQIRAHCNPGAPVLISFFHRDGDTGFFRGTTRIANVVRRVRRMPPIEIGDSLSIGYSHRFTAKEVAEELKRGGFQPAFFKSEPYAHAVGIADS